MSVAHLSQSQGSWNYFFCRLYTESSQYIYKVMNAFGMADRNVQTPLTILSVRQAQIVVAELTTLCEANALTKAPLNDYQALMNIIKPTAFKEPF